MTWNWMCELLDEVSFKAALAVVLGALGWLVGGFDLPFKALVVLFLGDYLLGFGRAVYHRCISLERMRRGAVKFLLYTVAVMMAHMLDLASEGLIPWVSNPVRDFMVCYLAVCEFLSVSVHLAAEGVRMPHWLLSRIQRFRDMAETGECKEMLK
ncbi:phage holin family protein [Pseudodesulfovibrio pelocollis]|uniref:phage holin family protein n=1 Tax=Pseudodesulfovibrio pelocollis TaxID=3051432 RepID=UPI00255AD7C2|nr:phage holin family protein [Pseudodesulfovibrio sp. SB368]